MSFTFGATGQQPGQQPQQGSTSFSFGQPAAGSQPRFAFGATPTAGGFNFGTPSTSASSFAFGTPPQNTQSSGGFSFGSTAPTTTTASSAFSFGPTSGTPQSGGFNFAPQQAPSMSGSFSFAPAQTTASSGFSFGTQAATTTPSFAFNASQPAASQNSSFSFGNAAPTTATSGFAFGSTPATTTASSFAFGSTPSSGLTFGTTPATTASSAFGFGTPVSSAASTPFGFSANNSAMNLTTPSVSQAQTPAPSSFSFGATPANTTVPTSMPAFGGSMGSVTGTPSFSFGTPTTSAQPTGFGFGATTPATSATSITFGTPATAAPNSALNMGGFQPTTTPSFSFSASSQAQPTSSAPTVTPVSGFSFGPTSVSTMPSITPSVSTTGFGLPAAGNAGGDAARPAINTSLVTSSAPTLFSTPQTTTAESGGSAFPTTAVTTTAPVSTTSSSSGFGFGTTPASTTGGFSFGQTTTAPTGFSSSISNPPSAGFSVTMPSLLSTSNSSTLTGFTAKTSGSLFPASTTLTTSAPSSLMFGDSATSLSATSVPSSTAASLTTPTTVTPSSAAAPTPMNFRQLEDAINKWKEELDEQEKNFLNQATRINAWDRLLINNAEKITAINDMMERAKLDQQRLENELDFVVGEQTELENAVLELEKNMESLTSLNIQQHADIEREHTFHLAENIDAQLKRMSDDIKEIIEYLNTANKTQDDSDPVLQIAKILNAHMDALKSIDHSTITLQKRLESTAKYCEIQKKNIDRDFRGDFN